MKQRIWWSEPWYASLQRYFIDYSRYAQVHGIRFLSRRTSFERFLWGLLTLCSILIMISQIIILVTKFHMSPLVVSFATRRISVYDIPFPAVTICSDTIIKKSDLSYGTLKNKIKNKHHVSQYEQSVFEYLYTLCEDSTPETQFFGMNHFTSDFYKAVTNLSSDLTETLVACHWLQEKVNCSEIFTRVFIDEGICYSFNFLDKHHIFRPETYIPDNFFVGHNNKNDWNIEDIYDTLPDLENYPRRAFMAGSDQSLKVSLKMRDEDIDFACKSALQGFKIILHNQKEIPKGREFFYQMSPGHSYIAAISPRLLATSSNVATFSPRQRNCYLNIEKPLKYFTTYLRSNCYLECLSNFTLLRCECIPYDLPRSDDVPLCGALNVQCVNDAEYELEFLEMKHRINTSATKGPSFCDCLPSCTELSYHVEFSTSSISFKETEIQNKANYSLSNLNIYFKENFYEVLQKHEVFSLKELIAKIGGLFGLYSGVSIISVIELLYYLSCRIGYNKRLYGRWSGARPLYY